MRASIWPLFVLLEDVLKWLFHLRQISRIKQYDAIDEKYVRRRVWFTGKNPRWQKGLVGNKIAPKEIPMTIKSVHDDEQARAKFSYTSTAYLADLPKHWGVCAETYVEYVQSTCKVRAKWEQGYGPRSPGGGYNRIKFKMFLVYY